GGDGGTDGLAAHAWHRHRQNERHRRDADGAPLPNAAGRGADARLATSSCPGLPGVGASERRPEALPRPPRQREWHVRHRRRGPLAGTHRKRRRAWRSGSTVGTAAMTRRVALLGVLLALTVSRCESP